MSEITTVFYIWIMSISPEGYITSSHRDEVFYGPGAQQQCEEAAEKITEQHLEEGEGILAKCHPHDLSLNINIFGKDVDV